MKEFRFTLPNQPGTLARTAAAFGEAEVNIEGIVGMPGGRRVSLVVDDEGKARAVLRELGLAFEEMEAWLLDLPNRPGELEKLLERLAAAGVNLDSIYPAVEPNTVILTADSLDKARKILG